MNEIIKEFLHYFYEYKSIHKIQKTFFILENRKKFFSRYRFIERLENSRFSTNSILGPGSNFVKLRKTSITRFQFMDLVTHTIFHGQWLSVDNFHLLALIFHGQNFSWNQKYVILKLEIFFYLTLVNLSSK